MVSAQRSGSEETRQGSDSAGVRSCFQSGEKDIYLERLPKAPSVTSTARISFSLTPRVTKSPPLFADQSVHSDIQSERGQVYAVGSKV